MNGNSSGSCQTVSFRVSWFYWKREQSRGPV